MRGGVGTFFKKENGNKTPRHDKGELEWAVLGVRDKGSFEPFLGVVCRKMYCRKVTEMHPLGMTF